MVRRIEPEVAQNRAGRRRIDASFINTGVGRTPSSVSGSGAGGETLTVTDNELGVSVTAELYTRDLGSDADPALVVGHPDPEHGVGRGAVGGGTSGGGWTLVDEPSASLTTTARRALLDALVAEDGMLTDVTIDSGATEDGETSTYAYGVVDASSDAETATATARGIFQFHEHGGTVAGVGADADDGTTIATGTTGGVAVEDDQELRVDVRLTVTPDPVGDTAVTDAGERALAESLVRPTSAIAFAAVAIGTGESLTAETDTQLVTPLATKAGDDAEAVLAPGRVAIRARWYRNEPDAQPATVREIGVLDGNGELVYRARIQPVEKDDTVPLTAGMSLTLRER